MEVKLIAVSKNKDGKIGPEEISAYGAMGCHFNESSYELIKKDLKEKTPEEIKETCKMVFEKSAGIGHGSVLDQNSFTFSIKNLPRLATLFLCKPEYLAHLQQSMRFVNADKSYSLPNSIIKSSMHEETKNLLDDVFEFYEKIVKKGLPMEDARFLLPLYSNTNIQTTGNARELGHLFYMAEYEGTPSAVKNVIEKMKEEVKEEAPNLFNHWKNKLNFFATYPSAQLFIENKTIEDIVEQNNFPTEPIFVSYELSKETIEKAIKEMNEAEYANLKHIHNFGNMEGFLIPMSVACFHQAIRQRTWNHSIESLYSAAERKNFVIPPSIKNSDYSEEFRKYNEKLFELYEKLIENNIPKEEAIGILPHSLEMYDFVHINGFNAVHSIGKRTCTKAQWEIREKANKISEIIREKNPLLGEYTYPQGIVYGKCPEEKPCGLCDKIISDLKK